MKSINFIGAFCLILLLMAGTGLAKDLTGNLGVGFNTQISAGNTDAISVKYWYTDQLAVQGIFGFVLSDDYDEYDLGGKVYFKIKDEENLHVDAYGGMGFAHIDPNDEDTDTGIFFGGGLSIEYFFNGLPNLGFSTDIGMSFADYDDNNSFSTTADTSIIAGIHYYFDFMPPPQKPKAK